MKPEDLRERITAWAVDVNRLIRPLFNRFDTRIRASQLKRSTDSAASNYRAACIARSHNEFLSKISIALEEADESLGWLEMSEREGILKGPELGRVLDEARQLTRILAKSRMTAEDRAERRHGSPRFSRRPIDN
ncbi:MAG TPA: four helix bundle protein [Vicinamibacterales bacterium]